MPAYPLDEYLNLPESDQVWIWKGITPSSGATLIFSNPKVGKSFLSLGLAEAVADPSFTEFLGLPILQHGKVLYLQLDTPRNLWRTGYCRHVSKRAQQSIYTIDRQMEDLPQPFDIRLPGCQKWLWSEVQKVNPVMTIIDTLRRVHTGDENDNTVVQATYDALVRCTQPSALMLLHHAAKRSGDPEFRGSVVTLARGASALMGSVDSLIYMEKSKLEIIARSDVEEEMSILQQDNGFFRLDDQLGKVRDFLMSLPEGMKEKDKDAAVAQQFGFSARTAQRYRLNRGQ